MNHCASWQDEIFYRLLHLRHNAHTTMALTYSGGFIEDHQLKKAWDILRCAKIVKLSFCGRCLQFEVMSTCYIDNCAYVCSLSLFLVFVSFKNYNSVTMKHFLLVGIVYEMQQYIVYSLYDLWRYIIISIHFDTSTSLHCACLCTCLFDLMEFMK